ncbi:MAG: hypothetical protein MHPSP_000004 [Paramarteilia canceri]
MQNLISEDIVYLNDFQAINLTILNNNNLDENVTITKRIEFSEWDISSNNFVAKNTTSEDTITSKFSVQTFNDLDLNKLPFQIKIILRIKKGSITESIEKNVSKYHNLINNQDYESIQIDNLYDLTCSYLRSSVINAISNCKNSSVFYDIIGNPILGDVYNFRGELNEDLLLRNVEVSKNIIIGENYHYDLM